ncbi:MAG: hypothetical protein JWM69_818 [Candidatus Binatus sp.]|nr:hypothetical protein [Candidatus Binatus sp.]
MKIKPRVTLLAIVLATAMVAIARAHDMSKMDSDSDSGRIGAMGQMGSHMKMSTHMTMTESRPATAEDRKRGEDILATMRAHLAKYTDSSAALADGYVPYMESVPQDVYHFSNRTATIAEYNGDFDLSRPGSLLYEKKTLGGYKLVGAMYDAPPNATPEQLDKLIPLSLSHWHAHTNICLPDGVTEADVMNGELHPKLTARNFNERHGATIRLGYLADPRFGFEGTIADQAECEAVGGNFHRQIFGWMIHVYPFASDDLKVAFSTEAP